MANFANKIIMDEKTSVILYFGIGPVMIIHQRLGRPRSVSGGAYTLGLRLAVSKERHNSMTVSSAHGHTIRMLELYYLNKATSTRSLVTVITYMNNQLLNNSSSSGSKILTKLLPPPVTP
ncbi:hypothetical protein M422DRAFT_50034 [Sphaerobolus stellatus SS14]|uniref:Uncharacterized protein n=1 Tax=Sphaerobolus stellatus (strain SS14) TaxID=990650 RepID=A0A0C9VLP2_SPHS4|nr:hypothetical protein M422DRAFT_53111 [Sphaerobolus stellatus SS14]KIJ38506.1 hypothetical protein M422DRAFT_50034 [Sphaerobolus stellatus SS14]